MRDYPKTVLMLFWLFLAGSPALAASSEVWFADSLFASARAELQALKNERYGLALRRDSLERLARSFAAEVSELKRHRLEKGLSIFEDFRLAERLRAGQALADSIDALNLDLAALAVRETDVHRGLESRYTAAIDSLSLLLGHGQRVEQSRAILQRITELRAARSGLGPLPAAPELRPSRSLGEPVGIIRAEPGDTPEEILEKAYFLGDLADKLERRMGLIAGRLRSLDEERAIRRRIGEFTQEIALFDESLSSSGARVKEAEGGQETVPGGIDRDGKETFALGDLGPSQTGQSPGPGSFDLELYDLEKEFNFPEAVESLSADRLLQADSLLKAHRDSLAQTLRFLRLRASELKEKAKQLERE